MDKKGLEFDKHYTMPMKFSNWTYTYFSDSILSWLCNLLNKALSNRCFVFLQYCCSLVKHLCSFPQWGLGPWFLSCFCWFHDPINLFLGTSCLRFNQTESISQIHHLQVTPLKTKLKKRHYHHAILITNSNNKTMKN